MHTTIIFITYALPRKPLNVHTCYMTCMKITYLLDGPSMYTYMSSFLSNATSESVFNIIVQFNSANKHFNLPWNNERTWATNSKIGAVDWSKNENGWWLWCHFLTGYCIMKSWIVSFSQKLYFCLKSSNLTCYFLIFYISSNLRSNFCYYSRLERFKMILRISNVFGSRGGATEILTMISVQKCQFLAIS